MASKVFFTDFRTYSKISLPEKFTKFIEAAGLGNYNFKKKYVAIKMHFGEMGNLAYLRHQYALALCEFVKKRGGRPFLTDSNTLYPGSRSNGLDHLSTAVANGFNQASMPGYHVVIADGIKGTDEVAVPVEGAKYCPKPLIGRAVVDADIIISLNHFKGHESACFGGALKNLGMGCGSRAGKKEMHSSMKPKYDSTKCIGCKKCAASCAHEVQSFKNGKMVFDENKCAGCGRCLEVCPSGALSLHSGDDTILLCRKIAEYSKAVIAGKPNFHITLVCDVSPFCDCYGSNDTPIINDIGMFASSDPVAIDHACVDAVNKAKACEISHLTDEGHGCFKHDNLKNNHPTTDWKDQLEYAQSLGIGSMDYELETFQPKAL